MEQNKIIHRFLTHFTHSMQFQIIVLFFLVNFAASSVGYFFILGIRAQNHKQTNQIIEITNPSLRALANIKYSLSRMREEIISSLASKSIFPLYSEDLEPITELKQFQSAYDDLVYYQALHQKLNTEPLVGFYAELNDIKTALYNMGLEIFNQNTEQTQRENILSDLQMLESFENRSETLINSEIQREQVVLEESQRKAAQNGENYIKYLRVVMFTLNILSAAIAWFYLRKPFHQIQLLEKAAIQIRDGDLDTRVEPVVSNNEFGDLVNNFNTMTAQLQKAKEDLVCELTERTLLENQLRHDALHDKLTSLANRTLLIDRLTEAMARYQRDSSDLFAIMYMDLDRFKVINDSMGHIVGDSLLIRISERLQSIFRPYDLIARLGGDEFVILLSQIDNVQYLVGIAQRVQDLLQKKFDIDGHEIFITTSIGLVISNQNYTIPDDYLRDADIAMYRAKSMGKARFEIYDPEMHRSVIERLALENAIRGGLEAGEFEMYYQPIFNLQNGLVSGFESLLRWKNQEYSQLSPLKVISVIEEIGLMTRFGEWIIGDSVQQLALLQKEFPTEPPLTMSVNLSEIQLEQPAFPMIIERILQENAIPPSTLNLEISERSLFNNSDAMISVLKEIKALGVNIHLDDFGTGYSSLSYLHQFPIDVIKVDRSFVSNLESNTGNSQVLVNTIILMGQALGKNVVAEGIETTYQLDFLEKMNCEMGQGYYFAKPQNQDQLKAFLRAHIPESSNSSQKTLSSAQTKKRGG